MKTLSRLTLISALVLVLASPGRAQVLTADTVAGFDAASAFTSGRSLADPIALTQTFTAATSVENFSFRFIANIGDIFSSTSLNYTLGTWAGSNGLGQIGVTQAVAIDASGSWTADGAFKYFDADLDLSGFATGLTAGFTYGITLYGDATSSAYLLAGAATNYTDGAGFVDVQPGGANDFVDVTSGGVPFANDFAFVASAAPLTPVPEASSAAVLFAGIFVSGLMLRRQRHLRPSTSATAA